MKRIILFLIIIVSHLDVAHGSFPLYTKSVADTMQTEEMKYHHYNLQKMGLDLSLCKCISCRNGIEPIVVKPDLLLVKKEKFVQEEKRGPSGTKYVFFSILSVIASFVFGLLSLANGLSHTGSDAAVLPLFFLSLISLIGSIILAVKAKKHGVKWHVVLLALSLAFLVALFFFPLFFG